MSAEVVAMVFCFPCGRSRKHHLLTGSLWVCDVCAELRDLSDDDAS